MYNAIVNNLSPLPLYLEFGSSKTGWDARRWYAFGQVNPLLCGSSLPPFFGSFLSAGDAIQYIGVYRMCCNAGTSISGEDFERVEPPMNAQGARYISWYEAFRENGLVDGAKEIIYQPSVLPLLGDGFYYIDIAVTNASSGEYHLVSDIFRVVDRNERMVEIRWSNDERLGNGLEEIPAKFKNSLLLEATIAKPEYIYEEEGEERMGFFYPTKQISYKKYRFSFVAPEYLCDVVRMIPMCDHLEIDGGEVFRPTKIDFDFDWSDNGTLASVECEFTTNTIVKRVASSYVTENLGSFNDDFNNSFDRDRTSVVAETKK